MSMQDPIGDMFTRIRNAQMVFKKFVTMPYSNFKLEILLVLKKAGYIRDVCVEGERAADKKLSVCLKYYARKPVMSKLRRISKPSLRIQKPVCDIPRSRGGLGSFILTTSLGVMTDEMARKAGVGGEIIGEVA